MEIVDFPKSEPFEKECSKVALGAFLNILVFYIDIL